MTRDTIDPRDVPFSWFRKELMFKSTLRKGMRNKRVRFAQECLTLANHNIVVDNDFGPATERAVKAFQSSRRLDASGQVNKETFAVLIAPFLRALTPISAKSTISETVLAYARQHLKEHPREVGGQNKGPWVRLYMDGNEGSAWPWCAGFVTFLIKQAATYDDGQAPVKRTYSCDVLALRGKDDGQFVSERRVRDTRRPSDLLPPGTIFLNRKSRIDWTHTGIVVEADRNVFSTIEGNTNDDGHREGYEVCARTRNYSKKDFVAY